MNAPLAICSGFAVLGGCGVGLGIYSWQRSSLFLARSTRVSGTVTELVAGNEGVSAPKYRFKDSQGRERTVVSKVSSYPAGYVVGQSVDILFDEASGESKLDGWFERRGAETIWLLLFGVMFFIGLGGIIVLMK